VGYELGGCDLRGYFLVARLDLDVDGPDNTVVEVKSEAVPIGEDNPYGLSIMTRSTPIRSEAESGRDFNWATQRSWKVVNPNKANIVGTNVAYKLVPAASIPPYGNVAQYGVSDVLGGA
jgi:primary-amine oxidase